MRRSLPHPVQSLRNDLYEALTKLGMGVEDARDMAALVKLAYLRGRQDVLASGTQLWVARDGDVDADAVIYGAEPDRFEGFNHFYGGASYPPDLVPPGTCRRAVLIIREEGE